jgi:UDPglucose 6-dehydrogenase
MALKLSVIGCGYLGATHAACMSSLGFEVVGIDTDANKVAMLNRGQLPFYEPGLDSLLASEMTTGRLSFSTEFSDAADADVHFICVGTPQSKDGLAADLSYVKSSVTAIAPHLKAGALVVGKSTVPVGTAHMLREQLAQSAPQADLAWNPEFLREGFAVEDTLRPNRLVVGVVNDRAEAILKDVYKPIIDLGTPWIRADLPTAELVKVAANSFWRQRFLSLTQWPKFAKLQVAMSLY